ncbi:collagen alpha-1(I) chain-like [Pollicipes pollicipes]|uniref:collagen alpha-1(I) chain-like n=1 Tax=Pollicipes pollicipes TaxID=41117 RepID=UPI001884C039|nr:collagen alpha-1(I) chain-like [Pollicipes pollicipes]
MTIFGLANTPSTAIATSQEMEAVQLNPTAAANKARKKSGPAMDLNTLLEPDGKAALMSQPIDSWADEMDEIAPFKVFVSNVADGAEPAMLADLFRGLRVRHVDLPTDPRGRRAGHGHVEFDTRDDLIQALRMDGLVRDADVRGGPPHGPPHQDRRLDRGRSGDRQEGPPRPLDRSGGGPRYQRDGPPGYDRDGPRHMGGGPGHDRGGGPGYARAGGPGYDRGGGPGHDRGGGPGYDRGGPGYDRDGPRYDRGGGPGYDRDGPRYDRGGGPGYDRGGGPGHDRDGPRYDRGGPDRDGPRYPPRGDGPRYDRDGPDRGGPRYDGPAGHDRGGPRHERDGPRYGRDGPPGYEREGPRGYGRDAPGPGPDRDGRRFAGPPRPGGPDGPGPGPGAGIERGPGGRPRLNLKPRTAPSEEIGKPAAASSSIFGGARPVDTAAREREILSGDQRPRSGERRPRSGERRPQGRPQAADDRYPEHRRPPGRQHSPERGAGGELSEEEEEEEELSGAQRRAEAYRDIRYPDGPPAKQSNTAAKKMSSEPATTSARDEPTDRPTNGSQHSSERRPMPPLQPARPAPSSGRPEASRH